jgi:hypothetical protein
MEGAGQPFSLPMYLPGRRALRPTRIRCRGSWCHYGRDQSAGRCAARLQEEGDPLRRMPVAAWIGIGVLAVAIIAPASATAASNLVGIVGGNGARAAVTAAGQLQDTETTPGNFVTLYAFSSGSCDNFYNVPSG